MSVGYQKKKAHYAFRTVFFLRGIPTGFSPIAQGCGAPSLPSGHRPALVLSPAAYNGKTGLALFCPLTSQVKGYPFEVKIEDNPSISGVALADQVKNLDWRARGVKFATMVDEAVLEEVVAKFETLFKLPSPLSHG